MFRQRERDEGFQHFTSNHFSISRKNINNLSPTGFMNAGKSFMNFFLSHEQLFKAPTKTSWNPLRLFSCFQTQNRPKLVIFPSFFFFYFSFGFVLQGPVGPPGDPGPAGKKGSKVSNVAV